MKIDNPRTLIEAFCMFSLSTLQSNEHSGNWFHLRNNQKDDTLIDEFKNVVFKKVEWNYQDN